MVPNIVYSCVLTPLVRVKLLKMTLGVLGEWHLERNLTTTVHLMRDPTC